MTTTTPDLDTCDLETLLRWLAPRAEWARVECTTIGNPDGMYLVNDCPDCGGTGYVPRRDTAAGHGTRKRTCQSGGFTR